MNKDIHARTVDELHRIALPSVVLKQVGVENGDTLILRVIKNVMILGKKMSTENGLNDGMYEIELDNVINFIHIPKTVFENLNLHVTDKLCIYAER